MCRCTNVPYARFESCRDFIGRFTYYKYTVGSGKCAWAAALRCWLIGTYIMYRQWRNTILRSSHNMPYHNATIMILIKNNGNFWIAHNVRALCITKIKLQNRRRWSFSSAIRHQIEIIIIFAFSMRTHLPRIGLQAILTDENKMAITIYYIRYTYIGIYSISQSDAPTREYDERAR